jgi:hypothetical protein
MRVESPFLEARVFSFFFLRRVPVVKEFTFDKRASRGREEKTENPSDVYILIFTFYTALYATITTFY